MTAQPTPPPPWQDTLAEEGSRLLDAMRDITPQITEALVRYVWAEGVTSVAMGSLAVVVTAFLLLKTIPDLSRKLFTRWDDIDAGMVTVLATVLTVLAAGGGASLIYIGLPQALAPEGAAVMMALKALGGVQ